MGQTMSFALTQYDMEELIASSNDKFDQDDIESLYRRFRALDRGSKGYVSSAELLSIPELSINPLARRVERLFDSINFKEFVGLLAAFSPRASRQEKLRFLFTVHDIDGDGILSSEDLHMMLRQLAGMSLSDVEMKEVVALALEEAGVAAGGGLDFAVFEAALSSADLSGMQVEVGAS